MKRCFCTFMLTVCLMVTMGVQSAADVEPLDITHPIITNFPHSQ